jgi:uncharacterized membrane protein YebE (DUF533 family)
MRRLSVEERLRLLRFVCSFAWTDLQVSDEERQLVRRLVKEAGLDQEERSQVARWLEHPPAPEEVDPTEIPIEHRAAFLVAAREMIEADGKISDSERDSLDLFEELLT